MKPTEQKPNEPAKIEQHDPSYPGKNGHKVFNRANVKPRGASFLDWYYLQHPEEVDHRQESFRIPDECQIGTLEYQAMVLAGGETNKRAAELTKSEPGPREDLPADVTLEAFRSYAQAGNVLRKAGEPWPAFSEWYEAERKRARNVEYQRRHRERQKETEPQ